MHQLEHIRILLVIPYSQHSTMAVKSCCHCLCQGCCMYHAILIKPVCTCWVPSVTHQNVHCSQQNLMSSWGAGAGTTAGQDLNLSMERLVSSRNFTNKLWNAGKFILFNLEQLNDHEWQDLTGADYSSPDALAQLPLAERWVVSALHQVRKALKSQSTSLLHISGRNPTCTGKSTQVVQADVAHGSELRLPTTYACIPFSAYASRHR